MQRSDVTPSSTSGRLPRAAVCGFLLGVIVQFASAARADTVAVLTPDKSDASIEFSANISEQLKGRLRVLDQSLAESAYSSSPPENPFNLSSDEGVRLGTVIGADAIVIVRAGAYRRSSSQRPEYYEAFGVVYVFGTRSGLMFYWDLPKSEALTAAEAKRRFAAKTGMIAARIDAEVKAGLKAEVAAAAAPMFADASEAEKSPAFRAPVPYKRSKPEYTDQAFLYGVQATVDVLVYLDDKGAIVRTDIVRWAGFGLDESAVANIRSMNWRPAQLNGKFIATKFLVRYNFRKVDR